MRKVPVSNDPVHDLYHDHHPWLLGWLRQKLGGADQAVDLAHDTFLRVLQHRERATAIREPRAWLTTIARGLMIDHWCRQDLERAWLETLAARPEPLAPSAEHQTLVLEALEQVDRLLSRMPERMRRAFVLSQIQGLTYAEIATQIGVSERMIKKYMVQAMLRCIALDGALDINGTLAEGARDA